MTSPVITGHRGYKAKYVENTLVGFTQCYAEGATNFETDAWVTKDGILVISHDVNTKRIFCHPDGTEADYNILKTNYDEIKDLVTIKSGERLLRFTDMLNWYLEYGLHASETNAKEELLHIQLDIKRFNPPKIMRLIIEDLLSVRDDLAFWCERVQFGIWDINFLKYMNQTEWFQSVFNDKIPAPELFHISLNSLDSTRYLEYNQYIDLTAPANRYKFKVRGVLMIYVATWSRDFLVGFLPLLKAQNLCLYSWTINSTIQYDYLDKVGEVAQLREYGIITDDPGKMVEYKKSKQREKTFDEKDFGTNNAVAGDFTKIPLTWSQVGANYMFLLFTRAAGVKRVAEDELDFAAPVDGDAPRAVKISPVFAYIFFTLQRFGIF